MSSNVPPSGIGPSLCRTTLHHFTQRAPREPLIPPAWELLQLAASLIGPVFLFFWGNFFFFFALLDAVTYTCEHMEGIDGNWQT